MGFAGAFFLPSSMRFFTAFLRRCCAFLRRIFNVRLLSPRPMESSLFKFEAHFASVFIEANFIDRTDGSGAHLDTDKFAILQ